MPLIQGNIGSVPTTRMSDGTVSNFLQGRQGELIVSELHGIHYKNNLDGLVFHGFVTAVTVPVIAANLVSVFSLVNPASSPRVLEIIRIDVGIVLATTVVNSVNIYQQSVRGGSVLPTTFTAGTPVVGIIGGQASGPSGVFCTAATHIGTPVVVDEIGTFGAVTTTHSNTFGKDFNGTLLLAPGSIISVAMSTAAGTASGLSLHIAWSEGPLGL